MKQEALEGAQKDAVEIRTLPDGRIRYHEIERASKNPGRTRGHAIATEHNPKTGQVRTWDEGRDHSGNVIRVRPKMIGGHVVDRPHYPPTKADLENKNYFKKPKSPKKPKGEQ